MKTKIAVILILIAEIFSALAVVTILFPNYHCGHEALITPTYFTPLLIITFVLLLITACILWRRPTKTVWFSYFILALSNLGIMCWSAVYYLGTHCDGIYEIRPSTGLAKLSIIAAALISLSLLVLLSDIKRTFHTPPAENLANKSNSPFSTKIFIIFILITMTIIMIYLFTGLIGSEFYSCKTYGYNIAREDIQNAVTAYMTDSNNASQLPIINESATFTLTHPNGSYYIINMSELLASNGGLLREVPDGCIALTGTDNDNCDGGINGCDDTSHYIWGMDNQGNVASKPVNIETSNNLQCNACDYCKCDTCDGYQDIWP